MNSPPVRATRAARDVEIGLGDPVKAETRVDAALSKYRTGGYAINVHSYAGGFPVVACGNIPARGTR